MIDQLNFPGVGIYYLFLEFDFTLGGAVQDNDFSNNSTWIGGFPMPFQVVP